MSAPRPNQTWQGKSRDGDKLSTAEQGTHDTRIIRMWRYSRCAPAICNAPEMTGRTWTQFTVSSSGPFRPKPPLSKESAARTERVKTLACAASARDDARDLG